MHAASDRAWRLPIRATAVVAGLGVDRRWGEPPAAVHPVALFGRLMTAVEERLYRDNHAVGTVFAGLGVTLGLATGRLLDRCLGPVGVAVACASASASRMLGDSALDVARALEGNQLDEARVLVQALVGRDPRGLDAAEIARAVVESVAENSVDAVVAPVFWAAAAGAPGVLAHRAVNTLDAMVGHRSPRYRRFGWASARADDLAAWIPARVGALTVAMVRPRQARMVWRAVREQAPAHPSPNSGVAEAAFAAALGRQLGGTNRYGERVERRPVVGFGPPVGIEDIERATDLLSDVSRALMGLLLACGALGLVSRKSRAGRRLRRTWLPPLGSRPF